MPIPSCREAHSVSQQIRPVASVFYFVADLQAGILWYRALLGSDPVHVQAQLAMFQVGNAQLTVHANDEYNTSGGLAGSVAYWDVDDVDAVVAECQDRGGVAHRGPKTIFTGERLCQVLDPFGNLIGFRQARKL
jgi:predicted enzyme related to lactoylglutathione lyase